MLQWSNIVPYIQGQQPYGNMHWSSFCAWHDCTHMRRLSVILVEWLVNSSLSYVNLVFCLACPILNFTPWLLEAQCLRRLSHSMWCMLLYLCDVYSVCCKIDWRQLDFLGHIHLQKETVKEWRHSNIWDLRWRRMENRTHKFPTVCRTVGITGR